MNHRQAGYRFALSPLEAAIDVRFPGRAGARLLHVSGATWAQFRRTGLSAFQADRLAVRLGLHPAEVWVDWCVGATELEEASV